MRLFAAAAVVASGNPVDLKAGNFDSAVEGKNAFVKFFAPWCGHCKAMKPAWDQLGGEYKNHPTVLIGDVDCTEEQGLCSQHGVNGYPTLKYFLGDGQAQAYQGGRDLKDLKKFVEETLDTVKCNLANKEACDAESLAILEESEKMSSEQRSKKVKEMEKEMSDAHKEAAALKAKAKALEAKLAMVKLGGQKPPGVHQLLNNGDFEENCGQGTCLISFLPHILDASAAKRNEDLKMLKEVLKEEALQGGVPLNFLWSQGGDQFEAEEKLNLQFGFPALIAVNVKKGFYAVHRGVFDKSGVKSFAKSLMTGKAAIFTLPQGISMAKVDSWDGKDGEQPKEEDL